MVTLRLGYKTKKNPEESHLMATVDLKIEEVRVHRGVLHSNAKSVDLD